jgi:hypothetical protein
MTSILKADTIQDTDGNNIINENSNTITIGASGDTTNIIGTLQNNGSAVGGVNTPAFEAKITTEQNPTGATNVKINFDNEIFDTASAYSTTDKRFTVPSGQAGKYFIYSSTCIGSSINSGFNTGDLKIYKNGSDQNARGHFNTNNNGNGRYYQFSIFNIFDLSVGDYIEMYCYVNQTGTVEVRTAESRFGGYKIIE